MPVRRFVVELGRDPDHCLKRLATLGIDVLHTYPRRVLAQGAPAKFQRLLDEGVSAYRLREPCVTITGVTWNARGCMKIEHPLRTDFNSAEQGYHVVVLIGPVSREWRDELVAVGLDITLPLSGYGYVVRGTGEQITAIGKFAFVAWTEPFHPAFRLGPTLFHTRGGDLRPEDIRCAALNEGCLPHGVVELSFFPGEDSEEAVAEVEALGGLVMQVDRSGLLVGIDSQVLPGLARLNGVSRIDRFEPDGFDNDVSAGILNAPSVRTSHGLDGAGQRVALMETGVDTGVSATIHHDFQGRVDAWIPIGNGGNGSDDYGHGTHMAGTILGDGSRSLGQYRGVAPAATLTVLVRDKQGRLHLIDLTTAFNAAYAAGCRLQNNSWGKGSDSSYTQWSMDIDQFVWNHRDFLPVFSAGNSGRDSSGNGVVDLFSLRSTGTAKNCLCVGGCESDRPDGSLPVPGRDLTYDAYPEFVVEPFAGDHFSNNPNGMFFHSSRGPSEDGRIKPDVVAPATNILSARASQAIHFPWDTLLPGEQVELPITNPLRPFYFWTTGTSSATALVTGALALIRQYLVQQRGHHADGPHPLPSAALLKAIVINGAFGLPGQYQAQYSQSNPGPAPNPNQGWGRVDVEQALFPPATSRIDFSDNPAYALETNDDREFTVHVHDTTHPLNVTLVWTDAVGSGGNVVNQLYLRVQAPSGAMHDGDHDAQGALHSYADAIADGVNNNVQKVSIATPELGTHAIRVHAINVSQGVAPSPRPDLDPAVPVQDFALVVANASGFAAQPVAVMQAVDRSASMAYYGYMEPAKRRAEELVDILRINDKTGIVSFNHNASVDYPLGLMSSYPDKQGVKTAIDGLASAGLTSIGAGIRDAQTQFTDDGLPHAIIVLSDGFSNAAPYAVDPPDGSAPVIDQAFIDSNTTVYTIALGPTADIGRLSAIAAATSGGYYEVAGYSDLHKLHEIYYNLQALTTGGSLMYFASSSAAAGEFASYTAEMDGEASEAFFSMSFDPADERDEHSLEFTLVDPQGVNIGETTPQVQFRRGRGYCFYRVRRPGPGHWQLRVHGAHTMRDRQRYSVAALGDSSISMGTSIVGKTMVGAELTLRVRLDTGIAHTGFAVVRARVSRPSSAIGELLDKHADTLAELDIDETVTKYDDEGHARLALLDRKSAAAGGESIFTSSYQELVLSPTDTPGVFQTQLPKSAGPETLTIRISAHGVFEGRRQTSFTRMATFCVHVS